VLVAVAALAAETDAEAARLAQSGRLRALQFARGLRDLPFPSVAEAESHVWTEEDERLADGATGGLVGSAATVTARLADIAAATGADELMVTTMVHEHAARRRSYELLMEG
jgi:alkanesulfonate monooxygenase SsuD/methylene tetrahydromethanopterin reductase-like flavin-dependent oxidoreductase (luciferase family)